MAAEKLSARHLVASAPGTFKSASVLKHSRGYCAGALCGCGGGWKGRLIILKGGYLFKFATIASQAPSGVPIDVVAATVTLSPRGAEAITEFPERCLRVSTLRKELLLQFDTPSEARAWMRAIRNQADTAVKARLGHVRLEQAEQEAREAAESLTRRRQSRMLEASAASAHADPVVMAETAGLMGMGGAVGFDADALASAGDDDSD